MTSTHVSGRRGTSHGQPGLDGTAPAVPPTDLVAPAKAVRLLGMLSDGLVELRRAGLDDAACDGLAAAYRAALTEVASAVSDALIDELVALHFHPLDRGATLDEIRVAHAQLTGWVNGLLVAEAYFGTTVMVDDAVVGDDGRVAAPGPIRPRSDAVAGAGRGPPGGWS